MKKPICPKCFRQAYRRQTTLGDIWFCPTQSCDTRVGCHKGSAIPLGTMADAQLRKLRTSVHFIFDPLWAAPGAAYTRSQAYAWLSKLLGLPPALTHVALFNEAQCEQAIKLIREARGMQEEIVLPSAWDEPPEDLSELPAWGSKPALALPPAWG